MRIVALFLTCAALIGCGKADKPNPEPEKKATEVAPMPRPAG